MNRTVRFDGTYADAMALAATLPEVFAGRRPDTYGVARAVQLRTGVALLSQIQLDFIRKSRGEVGRDGIKWPPLSPKTVAYNRRTTRKELSAAGIRRGPGIRRPSLSAAEDRQWRELFTKYFRIGLGDMPRAAARRRAAAIAWSIMKRQGAKTVLELLGGRKVDMLRDTGLLFKSFSPGVEDRPSGAPGQVFRIPIGRVIVGTNQKPWHHTGDPAKNLPARLFWPRDGSLPDAWRPPINRAASTGVAAAVVEAFGGGRA